MTHDEIRAALDAHAKWLETNSAEGTRAVLEGKILYGFDFSYAKLSLAVFTRCDMRWSDFSGASMQAVEMKSCDLRRTTFDGANLDDGSLRFSDLRAATFVNTKARCTQFSGCKIAFVRWDGAALNGADFSAISWAE